MSENFIKMFSPIESEVPHTRFQIRYKPDLEKPKKIGGIFNSDNTLGALDTQVSNSGQQSNSLGTQRNVEGNLTTVAISPSLNISPSRLELCLKPLEMRIRLYLYLCKRGVIENDSKTKMDVERNMAIVDPEHQLMFDNGLYISKFMFILKKEIVIIKDDVLICNKYRM